MSTACHETGAVVTATAGATRVALVGAPNCGKTSLFNALTGLRARTGNYPGVTVTRSVGTLTTPQGRVVVEDLPGTYSLRPASPDERIVVDVLCGQSTGVERPDAALVVADATTLRRTLPFVAQVLGLGLPVALAVTFTDELVRRRGRLDLDALGQALGVPVFGVVAGRGVGVRALRSALPDCHAWSAPVVAPPSDAGAELDESLREHRELDAWVESVLDYAGYRAPDRDSATARLDAVLLHPVWGVLVFVAVMVAFFQTIFTVAAPAQGWLEGLVDWLSGLVATHMRPAWLAGLLGDALLGGVGGVLVFVPQIALLFTLLALLEGSGYLARAAFLMDRVMARFGLEGRAFVALLSSFACAVPGIMATRTLPSARDRLATMMAAPLMTCSARLPVYVLLVGLLVDPSARIGPLGAQGLVMFGLYLLGAVSALLVAWAVARLQGRGEPSLPFALELPVYRMPRARELVAATWTSVRMFLRKCSTIIVATSVTLWLLLNLPVGSTVDNSLAAGLGRAVAPVFAPLGFDWRIDVGLLSAQAARETFVATLGQVAGDDLVLPAPTLAALLVWFVYALQCTATIAVLRRETGGWRWPAIAFGSLTAVAWLLALLTRTVVAAVMS
jgi:ferrous iron transport protein B